MSRCPSAFAEKWFFPSSNQSWHLFESFSSLWMPWVVFLASVPPQADLKTQKVIPSAWTFLLSYLAICGLTPPLKCFSHMFKTELTIGAFKDVLFPIQKHFPLFLSQQYRAVSYLIEPKINCHIWCFFPYAPYLTDHQVRLVPFENIYPGPVSGPPSSLPSSLGHYVCAGILSPNRSVLMENCKHVEEGPVVGWTPMCPSARSNNHQHEVVPVSSIFTLCFLCSTSFDLLWSTSMHQSSLFFNFNCF